MKHTSHLQSQISILSHAVERTKADVRHLASHLLSVDARSRNNTMLIHKLQCNSRTAPSFIPEGILKEDLLKMQQKLAEENTFVLTIPITQLFLYYQLEIADCYAAPNYTTAVVMVPITNANSDWAVYSVHNIAFQLSLGQVCTLTGLPTLVAVDEKNHK